MRDILFKATFVLVAFLVPCGAGAQESRGDSADAGDLVMLNDLAARFGRGGIKLTLLDIGMGIMRAKSDPTWREMVEETAELLEASNVRENLAAPPTPTDDALYNRYALAVDERLNAALLSDEELAAQMIFGGLSEDSFSVALLPEEVLSYWEGEWRDDPRYWELRAFTELCRRDPDELHALFPWEEDASPEKTERLKRARSLLDEAFDRGAVRGETLLLLYRVLEELEDIELAPLTTYETQRNSAFNVNTSFSLPERPEFTAEQLALSRELHARFEADELAVLDAAVEADPELAWAHYYRAMYWFERGESELGLADLAAGNEAPDVRFPLPFPLSIALESFDADAPAGSAAVAGAIMLASLHFDYLAPFWLEIKEHLREQFVAVNLSGDLLAFDAWHQFACRIPYSQQQNTIFQLVPIVVVSMTRDYVWEQGQLNDEQTETLMHLTGWHDAYMDAPKTYDVPDIELALVLGVAGGMHGVCVAFYVGQSAVLEIARGNLHFFEDAAQLRYPELMLPEALRKYEAMTPEERIARSRARSNASRIARAATDLAEQISKQ